MSLLRLRHLAEYTIFRLVTCLFQLLSPSQCAWLARQLAWFIHRCIPRRLNRFEVIRQNLKIAYGPDLSEQQIDRLAFRMWEHLFRMVTEIVHLPRRLHMGSFNDVILFRNRTAVLGAFTSGRPVILLSGHYGNWEMAISVFGLFGFPMAVIARRLDNPYLDEWFRRFRELTGHQLIMKKGAFSQISERLEARKHVALLGDQDAGTRGVFVDFFGREASTFKSVALLAIEHKALICVGYARRLPDNIKARGWVRYELGCEEIVDPLEFTGDDQVLNVTKRYSLALERAIRRAPEQYFWVHRRWKTTPAMVRDQEVARLRRAG